ncbi:short chain dehydrogenase [Paucilactobacillus hokkaidonensis JCM 18461]|uniref:Short chain dehydrogenase n=2 Tax=Paucilactobacillus hokkaidonensis TaxID=1193095 RepID=A0A0A1GV00_9LACO|nr:glucose 1-dehydrogenase [Paucilactobacillus hokkaidonensis]KRO09367.1 3-alpha-(or 20-beta)-hydroxysteroid dehydrogenase [Paucilactobacillus hokkaidonensis]BAP84874.1 short chain dehydrogenase [Paucilactobacillus hokkaidonensis JCM 18461]
MDRLKDKVAIITGGSQGMGAAHAKLFIDEGAKVVITDINAEKGEKYADELGNNATFIKQDVSSETDWQRVMDETKQKLGNLDILVNNAGITFAKSIFDITVDDYVKIFRINQLGAFLGTKYAAIAMKDQQHGSIVNISSLNGIVGGAVGYTDTKFAVRGLTKAAALELAHYNIRVNSVHPGVISTPMIHQGDTGDAVEQFAKSIPLQRIAKPNEVSKMVLFLASDDSSYSTGSEFVIDGGMSAQ